MKNQLRMAIALRERYLKINFLQKQWQEFQDNFDNAMKSLIGRISEGFEGIFIFLSLNLEIGGNSMSVIEEESKYSPQKMAASTASELLKDKKNIVILTGAGLSAASGIPTFRGNDGLWTKKYKFCDKPEDLATLSFFEAHPEVKWEWTHDFYELCKKSEPNEGHQAILKFQEYCIKNNRK